jgi:hypothetical protein
MKGVCLSASSALLIFLSLASVVPARAQSDKQVRLALRHIRDDDIPRNGTVAAEWLILNRNRLKSVLIDELERTDKQGRGAIMTALMMDKDFKPDLRFLKRVMSYLNGEEDEIGRVYQVAWGFFDRNYADVRPLLIENLNTTNSIECIRDTTFYFFKRRQFEEEFPNYGPHVWKIAADSLKDDNIFGNAGAAIEFYLTIGRPILPKLKELSTSKEEQTRDYATAMRDALNGSRRAYGYLASQTQIGDGPEWLSAELDRWDPHGSGPRKRYH